MKIHISSGNSKLRKLPNISLPPGVTCALGVPCYEDGCYARKAYTMYSRTWHAWGSNFKIYLESPADYFRQITEWLDTRKPEMFRWHVGGDIPRLGYLHGMADIAKAVPSTRFLAFTKRYDLIGEFPREFPENLRIILSAWPGVPMDNPRDLPIAWLAEDPRAPLSAFPCGGLCDLCAMCWKLGKGESVVFERH